MPIIAEFNFTTVNNKITNLTIDIPYKRAGNVISQQPVEFDVYKDEEKYSLVPCLDGPKREVANLPASLEFIMENGKPVSLRGKKDGNFHVIQDAVKRLQDQALLT